jgi:hypothetical protein
MRRGINKEEGPLNGLMRVSLTRLDEFLKEFS